MITPLSKWLVLFTFIFAAPVSADEALARANISIEYLQAHTTHQLTHDEVDIDRSEQAISDLNYVMEHYELSQADQNLIRMVRAFSLKTINLKRLNSGKKVDVVQAEQAIEDIDTLSAQLGTVELFYAAGHVAMHLLNSPSMAYDYWLKCAEGGHGGCMNIVATHSFTGENGLPIDLDKAVYWHKRVYESGIQYVCAGAFSANILRDIAFFLPDINTGHTWKTWQDKRDQLILDVAEKAQQENVCQMGMQYARDYVVQYATNAVDLDTLERAITLLPEKHEKQALLLIRNKQNLSQAMPFLSLIDNKTEQCSLTMSLLLYAKYDDQKAASEELENYLFSLSSEFCATEFAFLQRMQGSGRWETMGSKANQPLR